MTVQIGEKYRIKEGHEVNCARYNSLHCDDDVAYIIVTAVRVDGTIQQYDFYNDDDEDVGNCSSCFCEDDLMPMSGNTMGNIIELNPLQVAHLDEDTQALVRVGVLNPGLDIVSASKLQKMLLELNYKQLAAAAKQEIADAEAKAATEKAQ